MKFCYIDMWSSARSVIYMQYELLKTWWNNTGSDTFDGGYYIKYNESCSRHLFKISSHFLWNRLLHFTVNHYHYCGSECSPNFWQHCSGIFSLLSAWEAWQQNPGVTLSCPTSLYPNITELSFVLWLWILVIVLVFVFCINMLLIFHGDCCA